MKPKVLITGGAGFIGSHITDKLLQNDFSVIVIDNLTSGDILNLPQSGDLKLFKLDIADEKIDEIFSNEKPDFVIHLAAQTSVNYSIKNIEKDAELNILSSIKIIELSKKYNVKKFITASTAAVYGIPQYLPIDENHPTEPISPYGLSKLTMEKYIKLSSVPYVIFRFSNAFGPRQKSSKESGVIAIFHKAMLENQPVNIYGDGSQIRDFIYVEDIADVCAMVLKSDIKNEILNFSTNTGCTLNELFNKMKSSYNYKMNANYLPERKGDIKDSILSNEKILSFNKNMTFTPLSLGIEKLKDYYKK